MKPKVYGKKTRLATAVSYEPLTSSSPETHTTTEHHHVLAERSSNMKTLVACSNSRNNHIRKSNSVENRALANVRPGRIQIQLKDEVQATSTSPSQALAASLQQLQISVSSKETRKFSPISRGDSKPPAASPMKPPAIRQPAPPSASSLSHLSPLLSLKTVSPTIKSFSSWLSTQTKTLSLSKIGEGSFGEVYRATTLTPSIHSKHHPTSSTAILKLIPLAPPQSTASTMAASSQSLTTIQSATSELLLLAHMQRIPGFVHYRGAVILRGSMPPLLRQLWKTYKATNRTVATPDPNLKRTWGRGQLWLMIEMEDSGTALEDVIKKVRKGIEEGQEGWGVKRTWAIWWGIVRALARGEWWAGFEHRDLHGGNVCLKKVEVGAEEEERVTIIDYSLSRAEIANDRILAYDFLSDEALLTGEGDVQYDVYRSMAHALKEVSAPSCEAFVPKTNLLWLRYLLMQLLGITGKVKGGEQAMLETKVPKKCQQECRSQNETGAETWLRQALEELQGGLKRGWIGDYNLGSAEALLELGIIKGWVKGGTG